MKKSMKWVADHSVAGAGVSISSLNRNSYPEVTGYFIPTLISWGERERAMVFARWLVSCQRAEGAWGGPNWQGDPYVFDTGQVLKGLLAAHEIMPDPSIEMAIRRACDWVVGHIDPTGKISAPDLKDWAGIVPIGAILYAYEPIMRASKIFGEPRWYELVKLSISWFLAQSDLTDFKFLSHFHAYVLEALCDLGFHDRAREGMRTVDKLQARNGSVPAFPNVKWVCSTGLFQYAIVWYKLGDQKRADAAFKYAMGLQNSSGGWFGSYGFFRKYFPKEEISWAVKYFLDAMHWRLKSGFEAASVQFSHEIDRHDGRYLFIKEAILESGAKNILDAGCGKGRYLRLLQKDFPVINLNGIDISERVISSIPESIHVKTGSLHNTGFDAAAFDFVYCVEALEHAVHVGGAIRELLRVTRPGGKVVVIDKNIKRLGKLKIAAWEQWFSSEALKREIEGYGAEVRIHENLKYEAQDDGLFTAWVATKI